jgi:CHAD domain-containing protein
LAGLAGRYLDAQSEVLVRTDVGLRRGHDAVHEARVATRRYRSVLRELGTVFDAARWAELDAALKEYASALGEVRDRHVLRSHLDDALAQLPPELVLGPVAARIHQLLAAEEAAAMNRLAKQMRTRRHYALLAELRAWREELPVVRDRPASRVARVLGKAERKVGKRIAAAPAGAGRDAALHRARKAAKRGRYVAELARPELGGSAKRARRRMKKAQQRLGMRQDSVVAAEFLRRAGAAAAAAGENGFTFGLLYEREQARAAHLG